MNPLSIVPLPYRIGAMALLVVASFAYGWFKGHVAGENKYQAFVAETRNAGQIAQKAAEVQKQRDEARKVESDASYKVALSALSDDVNRLRAARANTDYLPAPAPTSQRPDLACFLRADLERAIRQLDADVSGIVAEGDTARLRLDTAIRWGGNR